MGLECDTLCPQGSGQPVPLVVESCIRFINLNGKHAPALLPPGAQHLEPHAGQQS